MLCALFSYVSLVVAPLRIDINSLALFNAFANAVHVFC